MSGSISFGKGFVYRKSTIYVDAALDDLDENDEYHTVMLRWSQGKWGHWTVQNRIISHIVFDGPMGRTVMAMGIDGRIQVGDRSGFRWETVDIGDEAPSNLRHLTTMRIIGRYIYVAGMARQVYRKAISGGRWERADQGALVPRKSLEIAGFKAIDGLHDKDIYAVGFYGEVWHFDGSMWHRLDSPTNVKLVCVRCLSPDLVLVGGDNGIVIRGNKDKWEIVNNEVTNQTIWGIGYFMETLYLSTNQGALFKLEDDKIVPVDMGFDRQVSTGFLHANDGVLLSVGVHDLVLFDGKSWTEIPHP